MTNLVQILVASSHEYDFSRVLSITPSVDFLAGLKSPVPQVNLTVLALLEKAKYHKSDIGIVAGEAELVGAWVRLWLCTPDTAVATRAHDVLLALLLAEIGNPRPEDGREITDEALLWRRIFRDKDIYGSIFSTCSLSTAGQEGQLAKRDKTLAQARLLDMLLHIDSQPVRTSQLPDVEELYGVKGGAGILHYAAIHMVDYRDDVLMHMTLLQFYAKYLSGEHSKISTSREEYPLQFLQTNGLQKRAMKYFLDPDHQDPVDVTLLYGPSANYLAIYCSTYPEDLLKQKDLMGAVLSRLTKVLENVTRGQWAQGQVPNHDLHVLASVPRIILFPRNGDSPLFHVPANAASPDTLNALAHILHGPGDIRQAQEKAAARALYFSYMERWPKFWTQIVSAAETVAVKEVALAAVSLIGAVITAQWAQLPSEKSSSSGETSFELPTEGNLAQRCGVSTLPSTGIAAIMSEPAIGIVVPYLMKPAQTFSNLVGGGRGDVESAAYKVAVAKHDVLVLFHQELKGWVGDHPDAQDMVTTVGRRVAQGPMGGTTEIGGRIGTLEL